MRSYNKTGFYLILVLWLGTLSGCIAVQPFGNYARPGDTITLAVGSQDGMTKANTSVVFVPDSSPSTSIDVSSGIRAIFKLYADKVSRVYSPNNSNAGINFSYLRHENWQTVIALDLPTSLPVGPGTFQVQTTVPQPGGVYPDVNTVPIRIEILAGTGAPNPLQYKTIYGGTLSGSYSDLQAARQAQVVPPATDPQNRWTTPYGAVQLQFNLPLTDVNTGTLTENNVRVVVQDITTYTRSKLQMTWSLSGNTLTVLFLSANGGMQYYEPRFSIMADSADFTGTPTILSASYFDVNGNVVAGPAAADYSISVTGLPPY